MRKGLTWASVPKILFLPITTIKMYVFVQFLFLKINVTPLLFKDNSNSPFPLLSLIKWWSSVLDLVLDTCSNFTFPKQFRTLLLFDINSNFPLHNVTKIPLLFIIVFEIGQAFSRPLPLIMQLLCETLFQRYNKIVVEKNLKVSFQ